jgi:hypothetical protein
MDSANARRFQVAAGIFLFAKISELLPGPTQHPIHWENFRVINLPQSEAHHTPSTSGQVKNVSVRLVKLKENFTSTEYLRTDCP